MKGAEMMTNEQFEGILNMIMQILEGCSDLETAKKRIKKVYPKRKQDMSEVEK